MKTVRAFYWLALAALPLLSAGCATERLWNAEAFREPWNPPHLQLAFDETSKDVLVRYDEGNDRAKHPTPRAYFLFHNLNRIETRRRPLFVDPRLAAGLKPIEVFAREQVPDNATALALYAIAACDSSDFKLFSRGREVGEFHLPVYKDGVWQTRKAMLMPLAIGADATIVGGVLALWYLDGIVGSPDYWFPD